MFSGCLRFAKNTPNEVLNGVVLADNLKFKLKLNCFNVNQKITQNVF